MNNVIITKKGNIEYIQFNKLLEFKDELVHSYTLKTYNIGFNRKNNVDNIVEKSYKAIADALKIDKSFVVHPIQKHTDNIYEYRDKSIKDYVIQENCKLKEKSSEKFINEYKDVKIKTLENVDGIISNVPNVAPLLTFADCMSLLMYDPKEKVIANIHSGWQGTVKQIGIKAIQKMIKDYDSRPENIICCLGPSIRKDHFLVNDDVKEIFENEFKDLCKRYNIIEQTEFINEKGKQYSIDTVLIYNILLKEIGLLDKNIIDSNLCTMCNSNMFHSRRAEGEMYQTNGALMMLKGI